MKIRIRIRCATYDIEKEFLDLCHTNKIPLVAECDVYNNSVVSIDAGDKEDLYRNLKYYESENKQAMYDCFVHALCDAIYNS